MTASRYPQFCALARAAELVGERWTLLIVRELLLGPKRFSDLRQRLDGISTSTLAQRLARLEEAGLARRSRWEPPAAATVYELTELGRALEAAVFELIRWGARFLLPRQEGDRLEPDWIRLVLSAYGRNGPTPDRRFEVRITAGEKQAVVCVEGGPAGTRILTEGGPPDLVLTADVESVLGLMAGLLQPQAALEAGRIQFEGDPQALSLFPELFDTRRG